MMLLGRDSWDQMTIKYIPLFDWTVAQKGGGI